MGYLLLFLPLAFIAYEDFRYRAIHWAWLVVLVVGVLWCFPVNVKAVIINLLLVCFQLALLTLYFSLKEKELVFLPKQHLGWGDILFYLPLCLLFSPVGLILFLIGGFVLTLLAFAFYNLVSKKMSPTIPLAGCLSVCLGTVLLMGCFQEGPVSGTGLLALFLKNTISY